MQSFDVLFTPFHLNGLELSSRIAMAPMTRSFSPGGVPNADVAAYYTRRAEAGVGLIITEGTFVNVPYADKGNDIPLFHGAGLEGWRKVVDSVHRVGGRIFPQLWHVGAMRTHRRADPPARDVPSHGPSGILFPDQEPVAEPMTPAEIDAVIEAFAQGAADAKAIGFDGIEIHGAHGYLVDQFFWEKSNRRSDKYGGSIENRARFAADIVAECRRRVGPSFPICLRFSQWKIVEFGAKLATTPAELERVLRPVVDAGVDILHASTRRFWEPEFEGSTLNLAGWARKVTGLPAITVGSVGLGGEVGHRPEEGVPMDTSNLAKLVAMAERGEFDLVSVGRSLLADPFWADKVRQGRLSDVKPYEDGVVGKLY